MSVKPLIVEGKKLNISVFNVNIKLPFSLLWSTHLCTEFIYVRKFISKKKTKREVTNDVQNDYLPI